MHLANGLRYEEIGERMGLSLSSIKQSIAAARRRAGANTIPHLVSIVIANGDLVWNEPNATRSLNEGGESIQPAASSGSS
jgi:predicted DNA-binding protein (UPF0251 family)